MSAKRTWPREACAWLVAGLLGCGLAALLLAGLILACIAGILLLPLAVVCWLMSAAGLAWCGKVGG